MYITIVICASINVILRDVPNVELIHTLFVVFNYKKYINITSNVILVIFIYSNKHFYANYNVKKLVIIIINTVCDLL